MKKMIKLTEEQVKELEGVFIEQIDNCDLFDKRRDKAWEEDFECCPVCGKAIKNEKFFLLTIWGGVALKIQNEFTPKNVDDSWYMPIGSECKKKFPKTHVTENPQ